MEELSFNFEDKNNIKFDPAEGESEDEITMGEKKRLPIKKASKMKKSKMNIPKQEIPIQKRQVERPFIDRTFESLGNPTKMVNNENEEISEEENEVESEIESERSEAGGYMQDEEEDQPLAGFATIEEEKQDLLYKFHRLETKGIKVNKKFNMYSDIKEMRIEYQNIKKDAEVNTSVKFSRKMLMAVVSGMEFLNNRYDPFALQLDGWSETVMENVTDGDYDNVFERLHDKYSGKVSTPPEIELLLSLGGSALMFHMTSSMFKGIPNMKEMARSNPDLQNAMKSMAENLMKAQSQSVGGHDAQAEQIHEDGSRVMRGPSINMGGFGDMLPRPMPGGGIIQEMPNIATTQLPSVPESVISDTDSESGISVKNIAVSEGGTRRGRKSKIAAKATRENTIEII